MKDVIKIRELPKERYDKMQIALAIKNSTFNDQLSCSLLENNIFECCSKCNLKCICDNIENLADDYKEKTTKVITNFEF